MTDEQKDLTRRAAEKWEGKTIEGPKGVFFVSVVYFTYNGLEALLFPKEGFPITLGTRELKDKYRILT